MSRIYRKKNNFRIFKVFIDDNIEREKPIKLTLNRNKLKFKIEMWAFGATFLLALFKSLFNLSFARY